MTHFVITFRIKKDTTYQQRYESFVDHAASLGSKALWDETTSFIAMEAPGTAKDLCDSLYFGSMFDDSRDIMIVIDLDRRQKATYGEILYEHTLQACLGF